MTEGGARARPGGERPSSPPPRSGAARPSAAAARPGPAAAAPRQPAARPPVARGEPNVAGILIVATAALVATLVTFGIFLPALVALGSAGAATGSGADSAAGPLPVSITVCERAWRRDEPVRALTRDEVFARTDAEPVVVAVAAPACPAELGATGTEAVTTVYVQTGADAFVGYSEVDEP